MEHLQPIVEMQNNLTLGQLRIQPWQLAMKKFDELHSWNVVVAVVSSDVNLTFSKLTLLQLATIIV